MGVVYGSDMALVRRTLTEAAASMAVTDSPPLVVMTGEESEASEPVNSPSATLAVHVRAHLPRHLVRGPSDTEMPSKGASRCAGSVSVQCLERLIDAPSIHM